MIGSAKKYFINILLITLSLTSCGFSDEMARINNRTNATIINATDGGSKIDSSYQYRVQEPISPVLPTEQSLTLDQQLPIAPITQESPKEDANVTQETTAEQTTEPKLEVKMETAPEAKPEIKIEQSPIITPLLAKPNLQENINKDKYNTYLVEQGDTLFSISKKTGVEINTIKKLNNIPIENNNINIGHYLIIGEKEIIKKEESNPYFHVVQTKDTAYSISKRYSIPLAQLASLNKLDNTFAIHKDQKLKLKDGSKSNLTNQTQALKALTPLPLKTESKPLQQQLVAAPPIVIPSEPQPTKDSQNNKYAYPSNLKIISAFGSKKKGLYNDGLLFDVDKNSDVFAAKDGTVFFASYVKNYQNLIIIKHNDGLLSVYGNLEKMRVKKNDPILKGEQIGTVSPATSKTLFFSIRNTKKALDPMPYIK